VLDSGEKPSNRNDSIATKEHDNLLQWCRSNGAIIPESVILSSNLTGGYCLTTRDIPAGEPIFHIPHKLCITPTVATNAIPVLSAFTVHTQLCAFLCMERRQAGFWKPYFDVLPETFTTPLYFSGEELDILKGTSLYHTVSERINLWKQEYTDVLSVLPHLDWYLSLQES